MDGPPIASTTMNCRAWNEIARQLAAKFWPVGSNYRAVRIFSAVIFSVEQEKGSNWQEAESINVSTAVWCGMRMVPSPAKQTRQPSFQNGERAEPVEIWKTRKLIDEHSDTELSLTKVARAVNISPNHLSEKFKEVTGVNFVDYVARTRFEKARALLHDVDLRISEVAFAVGFQSLSQFNRVFKKLSGESPTQYRAARAKRNR